MEPSKLTQFSTVEFPSPYKQSRVRVPTAVLPSKTHKRCPQHPQQLVRAAMVPPLLATPPISKLPLHNSPHLLKMFSSSRDHCRRSLFMKLKTVDSFKVTTVPTMWQWSQLSCLTVLSAHRLTCLARHRTRSLHLATITRL